MPEYDAENFDPPAPVARVILRNPATGVLLSEVPMLIDRGADATLLPSSAVGQLNIKPEEDTDFKVQGFDGGINASLNRPMINLRKAGLLMVPLRRHNKTMDASLLLKTRLVSTARFKSFYQNFTTPKYSHNSQDLQSTS